MANKELLGTYHLAKAPDAYEPVRKNNFRFIADEKLNEWATVTESSNGSSAFLKDNHQEILDFSVVSFEPPHFTQEPIEIKRGNSKLYYAGVPSWDTKSLTINDYVGADGKSILMAWQARSYSVQDDTIPSSSEYKIDATVIEYSAAHEPIRSWKLEGCWITGITEDAWSNEDGGKKTVTATIRYDRAYPEAI